MQQYHPFQKIIDSKYSGRCIVCGKNQPAGSDYGRLVFSYGNPSRLDGQRGIVCQECQKRLGDKYYQYQKDRNQ